MRSGWTRAWSIRGSSSAMSSASLPYIRGSLGNSTTSFLIKVRRHDFPEAEHQANPAKPLNHGVVKGRDDPVEKKRFS
jgi:hypothetical protein